MTRKVALKQKQRTVVIDTPLKLHYVKRLVYDKIVPLHDPTAPMKIVCYFTGDDWVCPDPKSPLEQLFKYETLYDEGFFEDRRVICITGIQYHDKTNWTQEEVYTSTSAAPI